MDERCWCCASVLTTTGACPLCDMAGMVSPPHICVRTSRVIGDEDGCAPQLQILAPDHETCADFTGLRAHLAAQDRAA